MKGKYWLKGNQTLEAAIVVTIISSLLLYMVMILIYTWTSLMLNEHAKLAILEFRNGRMSESRLERRLDRELFFVGDVEVDYEETENQSTLSISAKWNGLNVPFFKKFGDILNVEVELKNKSGAASLRRKFLGG